MADQPPDRPRSEIPKPTSPSVRHRSTRTGKFVRKPRHQSQGVLVEDKSRLPKIFEPPERTEEAKPKWGTIVGAIVGAFVALIVGFGGAYQNAGVNSMAVAHLLIFAGWIGFITSMGYADFHLPLPYAQKAILIVGLAIFSMLIAIGADRLMVHLKAQQSALAPPGPMSLPSPLGPRSDASPPQATSEHQLLDIDADKLLAFFERYNEAQAEDLVKPYIGKWIEIPGRVSEVRRELLPLRDNTRKLSYGIKVFMRTAHRDKSKVDPIVTQALFEEQRWIDRTVVLKRNEDIKVRGQIASVFYYGFLLEHCEIIE